jgi:hypothetical protein
VLTARVRRERPEKGQEGEHGHRRRCDSAVLPCPFPPCEPIDDAVGVRQLALFCTGNVLLEAIEDLDLPAACHLGDLFFDRHWQVPFLDPLVNSFDKLITPPERRAAVIVLILALELVMPVATIWRSVQCN